MAHGDWVKLEELDDAQLTPMLRQFIQAKAESGDAILFFRMGDFFEMFFEDAIQASELLGLTLTSRDANDKHQRIPMAGVPVRSVDGYLAKLIRAGRTVAICDQVQDPKDAKGIVKRELIRTVTPGTVLEPDLLEERANNYLAAVCCVNGSAGLALIDVSTGEFLTAQIDSDTERALINELTRLNPAEVLISADTPDEFAARLKSAFETTAFKRRPDHEFDGELATSLLQRQFDLGTLKGLDLETAKLALGCAGAALNYVLETQRGAVPHLRLPRRYQPSGYVVLDSATQRNLELVETLGGKRGKGTLLHVLDQTKTSMGARKLRQWLLHPLLDVDAIRARLNAVVDLFGSTELRLNLRDLLKGIADLERLLGRLTSKSGNARDLKALGRSLEQTPHLKKALSGARSDMIAALRDGMDPLDDVAVWIDRAIVDEPPLALNEGGLFKPGHSADLDRLHELVSGGRDWIATLQRQESEATGIPKLKIGYNKIFGYYIEISQANAHLAPPHYIRKQTLVNAERYITPQLKEREEEIVNAQERMQKLEYDLFTQLRERIAREARRIHETADAIATLDTLLSLADSAASKNYCKPQIDASGQMNVRDGRHPVVEDIMSRADFVPNDIRLDPDGGSMLIITGPNMAGKSTYLRQVALIALMAQIGSFVPAAEASIGVVDRIFTRVGASDNLVRGESTFMVEMIETANILNSATERSLLILDEIGRGTSTFDGISIAWAVAEHIHDRIRAKTLFATHYHELTELGNQLEHARNVNVAVREYAGKVVFLYRIAEGGADHSYGIQVARLAGLPREVIQRARVIMDSLESGNTAALGIPQQLNLFGQPTAKTTTEPNEVEAELDKVDPDSLSPKDAHDMIYRLKRMRPGANTPKTDVHS